MTHKQFKKLSKKIYKYVVTEIEEDDDIDTTMDVFENVLLKMARLSKFKDGDGFVERCCKALKPVFDEEEQNE